MQKLGSYITIGLVFMQLAMLIYVWRESQDHFVEDSFCLHEVLFPPGLPDYVERKVVEDGRQVFQIDPDLPYHIELGQGSGWHGLDTVRITSDGMVVLFRSHHVYLPRHPLFFWQTEMHVFYWETATFQLDKDAQQAVLQAIADCQLLKLHKTYSANIADGTQWVLWIKQSDKEKSVYFDNHFPKEICDFAKRLDEILHQGGRTHVQWRKVPASKERLHEKQLWESIR
jgi:hypothetical protein